MVVPGVGRLRRPPWWQLIGCGIVMAASALTLAWVFGGGLAEAPATHEVANP